MHKLNIGDLVCYNAGGMKHKTLGIVMDFDFVSKIQNRSAKSILSSCGLSLVNTCHEGVGHSSQIANGERRSSQIN